MSANDLVALDRPDRTRGVDNAVNIVNVLAVTIHIVFELSRRVAKSANVIHRTRDLAVRRRRALRAIAKVVLEIVDHVLIMSVNPGFEGQKFIPNSIKKVRQLAAVSVRIGSFVR